MSSNQSSASNQKYNVSNISLYIPRIFTNITKEQIMRIFDLLDIGWVNHIDIISKMTSDGKFYNSAYIHFDYWYSNISNENMQEKLNNNIECRVVYDDPWYWLVLKNKGVKKDYSVPRPKINLTSLKEVIPVKEKTKEVIPVKETLKTKVEMFLPRPVTLTRTNKKKPKVLTQTRMNEIEEFEDYKEAMWDLRHEEREERERERKNYRKYHSDSD